MNANLPGSLPGSEAVPSTLDLVRLARRPLFGPGGKVLYHRIGLLTDLREGQEVLVVPSGRGTTLEYFVREFGAVGCGVDDDEALLDDAEARAREEGIHERAHFQAGSVAELPYRDGVFDVVIGELGLTRRAEAEPAVLEIARVLKPGGRVALVQLVWKAPVEAARREVLSSHLGVKPLMLVELKRLLREAGIEPLRTEGWSDERGGLDSPVAGGLPDLAELFSIPERIGILRRALGRWGWRGVVAALAREREAHRLMTRERILGLALIAGWKAVGTGTIDAGGDVDAVGEVVDLPLFVQGERR